MSRPLISTPAEGTRWRSVEFFDCPASLSSLFQVYAVGHEIVTKHDYRWDGLERHDGALYLFQYTLSGQGELLYRRQTTALTPGTLLMVPIPDAHCYRLPAASASWCFLYALVRQDHLTELWNQFFGVLGPVVTLGAEHGVARSLETLVSGVLSSDPGVWERSALVYALFAHLVAEAQGRGEVRLPPALAPVVAALHRDFRDVLSLDAMADLAGLSKFHFTRLFKASLGTTPGTYLERLRMDRAVAALQGSDLDVASVARLCGYANASYFIKVFRRSVGVTPAVFRERSRRQPLVPRAGS